MMRSETHRCMDRICEADIPCREDLEYLLMLDNPVEVELLFERADRVRRERFGDGIILRAILEFSNRCLGSCAYCGLNVRCRDRQRYRMTMEEILTAAEDIAELGIRTIVLQSGEDRTASDEICEVIERIKERFDTAITLSLGEHAYSDYAAWKDAGADRYLLKIETGSRNLYDRLHPGMIFDNRLRCLHDLKELGYEVGCGIIVGLPEQSVDILIDDILMLKAGGFDMVSIGPFIPHPATVLAREAPGDLSMTLKAIAIARLAIPDAHMPANTAVGNVADRDKRTSALLAGANVLMLNCTPEPFASLYEIYPKKKSGNGCIESLEHFERMASDVGRTLDYSRGDSIRTTKVEQSPSAMN